MSEESPSRPSVHLSKRMLFAAHLSLADGEEVEHYVTAEHIGEAFDRFLDYAISIEALIFNVELVSGDLLTDDPDDVLESGGKPRRSKHLKIVKKESD